MNLGREDAGNNGAMMGGLQNTTEEIVDEVEPDLPEDWMETVLGPDETEADAGEGGAEDELDDLSGALEEAEDSGVVAKADLDAMRERVEQLQAIILANANNNNADGNKPQTVGDVLDAALDEATEAVPNDESKEFFKKLVKGPLRVIVDAQQRQINALTAQLQDVNGKEVLSDLDTQLDALMTKAQLTPAEKRLYKSATEREAIKQHGQNVDIPKTLNVFRQLLKENVADQMGKRKNYVRGKQEKERNAAPPTERGDNAQARDDIQKRLHTSTERDMDFGGSKWRRFIREKIRRHEAAA